MDIAEPHEFYCHTCGAPPKQKCITSSGRSMGRRTHTDRVGIGCIQWKSLGSIKLECWRIGFRAGVCDAESVDVTELAELAKTYFYPADVVAGFKAGKAVVEREDKAARRRYKFGPKGKR